MRTIWIAMVAYLLAGCVPRQDYQPQAISEREAYAVITAVVEQQPAAQRPASAYLDSRYLGFRTEHDSAAGTPQDIRERIYFNSLDTIELRRSGLGYRVQLNGPNGDTLREFHLADRPQAERFIDALHYYREHAPAFTGLK
jgi:hypothetical protein